MDKYMLLVILANGFIWVRSSFGKVTGGKFVDTLGGTLEKFASNNPYPWFKDFLQNVAIPNSQIFGQLTMWGEVFVALTMVIIPLCWLFNPKGCGFAKPLLVFGLLGGMFLNAVFWAAGGWTSPSTESVNLVMFLVQGVALASVLGLIKKS